MPSESVRLRIRPIATSVESFLLRGGQQTARRNAWAAVVADRQRARDRREAERVVAALTSGTGRAGADAVRD